MGYKYRQVMMAEELGRQRLGSGALDISIHVVVLEDEGHFGIPTMYHKVVGTGGNAKWNMDAVILPVITTSQLAKHSSDQPSSVLSRLLAHCRVSLRLLTDQRVSSTAVSSRILPSDDGHERLLQRFGIIPPTLPRLIPGPVDPRRVDVQLRKLVLVHLG